MREITVTSGLSASREGGKAFVTSLADDDPRGPKPERNRLVVVTANSLWNIANFRAGLVRGLIAEGYGVVIAAPDSPDAVGAAASLGARFEPIRLRSSSLSPVNDAKLLIDYLRLFRRLRPFAMLGYTIKPNIYGTLAARLTGVRAINNISGLGTAFLREGVLQRLVTAMYRTALRGSHTVFFQNGDDEALFVARRIVRRGQVRRLPGSGVDLDRFSPRQDRPADGTVRFLLVARLLWDKGVGEFVEAARQLRALRPDSRFQLLGFVGADNRSAVPRAELDQWVAEGLIDYLGETDDVRDALAATDCVVLPSYREGLPRSLIEAAAMGKPVIATDVPGCRDAVEDGRTGFLCAVRSPASLRKAMERFMAMSKSERGRMGMAGRQFAEKTFDQQKIVDAYLDVLSAR